MVRIAGSSLWCEMVSNFLLLCLTALAVAVDIFPAFVPPFLLLFFFLSSLVFPGYSGCGGCFFFVLHYFSSRLDVSVFLTVFDCEPVAD